MMSPSLDQVLMLYLLTYLLCLQLPATMVFLKQSAHDWNYTAEFDKYTEKCHATANYDLVQGKMLGGTSSLNYYLYTRGSPADYDGWAEKLGDDTWTWKNVLPYFIKSEKLIAASVLNSPAKKYHGTEGNLGVSEDNRANVFEFFEAVKEMGHDVVTDINEETPLGYSPMLFTIAGTFRQSSALAYLNPAKDRPNLHVMKDTLVTKIVTDENKKAVGILALTKDGKTIKINSKKEVIVSAGALNTAKLLMASGIGPKEHLASLNIEVVADLPVGENLQDHVAVNIIDFFGSPSPPARGYPDPHHNPASAVIGYVALDKSQKYPDYGTMNFLVDSGSSISEIFCASALGFKLEICDDISARGFGKRGVFNQIVHLKPKSRGRVSLRSGDVNDAPLVTPAYFSDESDLDDLVGYVEHFANIYKTSYYKNNKMELSELKFSKCTSGGVEVGSREYWRCYASCMMTGLRHWSGTSAAGTVLDARLRVRGVSALRVADASVMPDLPRGNTFAPVVMIGEKAADFIKEDYKL